MTSGHFLSNVIAASLYRRDDAYQVRLESRRLRGGAAFIVALAGGQDNSCVGTKANAGCCHGRGDS